MPNLCYPTIYEALSSIGVSVNIILKDDTTRQVEIITTNHVHKRILLTYQFTTEFTAEEVRQDRNVLSTLASMFSVIPAEGFSIK